MAAGAAWVLNLDADHELAAGASYAPRASVLAATRAHAARLAETLLAPGDVLVDDATPPGAARGRVGRAFSPTPRALALLRRAGAEPAPHPPVAVLRAAASRALSAELGQTLPGARFLRSVDEVARVLAEAPPIGEGWRLKRAFGMAGRDHRLVRAGAATDADLAFARAAIAEDGVQVEPNVRILRELSMHGYVSPGGDLRLGALVEVTCDRRGAFVGAARIADPPADLRAPIEAEARRAARSLEELGYFGPLGVDAFVYAAPEPTLRARSEVNARYTMAWGIGLAR